MLLLSHKVKVGGRTVIFDLEIHMAEGVPMKSLSIGKAQNSSSQTAVQARSRPDTWLNPAQKADPR